MPDRSKESVSDYPHLCIAVQQAGTADALGSELYYDEPWDTDAEKVKGVRARAVSAIGSTWGQTSETSIWLKARAKNDSDEDVRQAAVQELVRGLKNDPDVQTFLDERSGYVH